MVLKPANEIRFILSYTLILPVLRFHMQQLMTSQIRSHIEYLIQMYNIFVIIL